MKLHSCCDVCVHRGIEANGTTTQFSGLRVQMYVKRDDQPRLKGKASEVRHCVGALRFAFEKVMDRASRVHVWIYEGLSLSLRMEQIIDETPHLYKLPAELANELETITFDLGRHIIALRRHFENTPGQPRLFRFTSKMHLLCHTALMARFIHPRLFWCWSGEDYMRKIQRLVASALNGVETINVVSKAMNKFCNGFEFDLEHSL